MRWVYFFMLVLCVSFVSAAQIEQNNFIFEYNKSLYTNIDIIPSGVVLDDLRMQFWSIGGLTRVKIDSGNIILSSSINQSIDFIIRNDSQTQYLYDGTTYSIGSVIVSQTPTVYELYAFPEDNETGRTIYKKPWGQKKAFFFVLNDEPVNVTNNQVLLILLGLVVFIFIIRWLF